MSQEHAAQERAADFAVLTRPDSLRLQRVLPGPIERVWAYLTDSALRRQWLAEGEMPAAVGGRFELRWRNNELTDPPGALPEGLTGEHRMDSTITEYEAPHALGFTWSDGSQVSLRLQAQGEHVLLTVEHRRVASNDTLRSVGPGWHMHLDLLRARLQGGPVEPFWDSWRRIRAGYAGRLPA